MAPEQSEGREVGEAGGPVRARARPVRGAVSGVNPVRGADAGRDRAAHRHAARAARAARRRDLPRRADRRRSTPRCAPTPRERGELAGAAAGAGRRRSSSRARRHAAAGPPAPAAHPRASSARRGPAPRRAGQRRAWRRGGDRGGPPAGPRRAASAAPHRSPGRCAPAGAALPLARAVWLCADGPRRASPLLLRRGARAAAAVPSGARGGSRASGWLRCSRRCSGLVGLAGAFPAIAGQARRWRERFALGRARLLVAAARRAAARTPAVARRRTPGRRRGQSWEGSLGSAATHVVGPLLELRRRCSARCSGASAAVLAAVARARRAAPRSTSSPRSCGRRRCSPPPRVLDAGLSARAPIPLPRGAVLGAVLGGADRGRRARPARPRLGPAPAPPPPALRPCPPSRVAWPVRPAAGRGAATSRR